MDNSLFMHVLLLVCHGAHGVYTWLHSPHCIQWTQREWEILVSAMCTFTTAEFSDLRNKTTFQMHLNITCFEWWMLTCISMLYAWCNWQRGKEIRRHFTEHFACFIFSRHFFSRKHHNNDEQSLMEYNNNDTWNTFPTAWCSISKNKIENHNEIESDSALLLWIISKKENKKIWQL